MKKVDEGVLLFDEIWEKVYSAEQQNQKEKYEMDLKKEIKKLQRLRDQIKTWIGSSDVKDKEPLIDARKLIETKMEQFKICEKETKTKTYSKEGLARAEKLDPAEEAKQNCTTWIGEYIDKLNGIIEDKEVEIERLSSGKGKKTNKHAIDENNTYIANHKFHVSKLEGIMRLVNNDRLEVDAVESIKEDLDYYLESYEDEDYQQAYDEDFFYESLGLEELDVVVVDRVTQAPPPVKKNSMGDDAASSSSKGSKGDKKNKKSALASVIPMTIGRARVSSTGAEKKEKEEPAKVATPSKIGRASSTPSAPSSAASTPVAAAAAPAVRTSAPPAHTGGTSMAAILKRETEQQEKERQKVGLWIGTVQLRFIAFGKFFCLQIICVPL
jgi:CCR4-NOT transcription complex subunit 3